jgi:hypothetical protein
VLALICTAYDRGLLDRDEYLHVENYMVDINQKMKGYHGKLRFWGLVEAKKNDDSTKKSSGLWRPTDLAFQFVREGARIPKYAFLFNNDAIALSAEETTFREVMKDTFNYAELMAGFSSSELRGNPSP